MEKLNVSWVSITLYINIFKFFNKKVVLAPSFCGDNCYSMTSFSLFYLVGMGRSSGGMGPKSKPGYSKKLQKLRKEFNEYWQYYIILWCWWREVHDMSPTSLIWKINWNLNQVCVFLRGDSHCGRNIKTRK